MKGHIVEIEREYGDTGQRIKQLAQAVGFQCRESDIVVDPVSCEEPTPYGMTYRCGNFGRKNGTVFPKEKSEDDRIENRDEQQSIESHTDEKRAIAYRQVQCEPYAPLGDFGNILRYADAYGGEQRQIAQQRIIDDGRVAVKNLSLIHI